MTEKNLTLRAIASGMLIGALLAVTIGGGAGITGAWLQHRRSPRWLPNIRQHPGFALLVRIGRQVIVLGIPELAVIARPDEKVCYSLNTALPVQQLRQTAEGRDPGQLRRMV